MRKYCSIRIVSLGAASVLASSAGANLITFDNSSLTYRWQMHVISFTQGNYLDVLQGPAQSGQSTPTSVRWEEFPLQTSSSITSMDLATNTGARLAQGTQVFQCQINQNLQEYTAVKAFTGGSTIGAGEDWQQFTAMGAHGFGPKWFFLDDGGTLGVKLDVGGQTHFGFITIAKVPDAAMQNYEYQPIAWGYETQPNTPVTVPTPGSVVLIGAAGVLALVRRR